MRVVARGRTSALLHVPIHGSAQKEEAFAKPNDRVRLSEKGSGAAVIRVPVAKNGHKDLSSSSIVSLRRLVSVLARTFQTVSL
jgi:hypothetical protein